jgi:hypothetical protein
MSSDELVRGYDALGASLITHQQKQKQQKQGCLEQKYNIKKTEIVETETEIEQKRPMCILVFLVEHKQNRNIS